MPRIFLPVSQADESGFLRIRDEKAHYLTKVLRCERGDNIEILDGRGRSLQCVIKDVSRKEIIVEITGLQPCDTESPLNLLLLQGLLKGDKMDLVIQKTTELGIKEIFPVVTERSQVRQTARVDRWRKIAEDASRQSGRAIIPVIHEPVEIGKILDSLNSEPKGFIFWEGGGISIKEAVIAFKQPDDTRVPPSFLYLTIGPEGGFTEEEVKDARDHGLIPVSLGRRILRAETAAIVSTALIQSLLGDL